MLGKGQRESDPNSDWEINPWHLCIHDGTSPCELREAQCLGQIMWALPGLQCLSAFSDLPLGILNQSLGQETVRYYDRQFMRQMCPAVGVGPEQGGTQGEQLTLCFPAVLQF